MESSVNTAEKLYISIDMAGYEFESKFISISGALARSIDYGASFI
jgi:hypothetical protein